jgi:carbamoyltransferase
MKDLLNQKVKHREEFRPFAPSPARRCHKNTLTATRRFPCSKIQLLVYPIKGRFHNTLPSVVHVDGTGRLQAVSRKDSRLFYSLIREFGKLSGVPVLINTSFNIRGEPIVCTPKDAYSCMMGTGIDYLVMGSFLIRRADNPSDIWDSESLAKD